MLKRAFFYKEQLEQLYFNTYDDPFYKYYHVNDHSNAMEWDDSDWSKLQFVSVNEDHEVLGYFKAEINRQARYAFYIAVMSFDKKSTIFARDLQRFFDYLLIERGFNKAVFEMVVGNPAEKMYDKFIERYNGRIVGTKEDDTVLKDGELHDMKIYEVKKENYQKARLK